MSDSDYNNFLSQLARGCREKHPPLFEYTIRIEEFQEKKFASICFGTKGCTHYLKGGCSMCNYDSESYFTPEATITNVKEAMSKVPNESETLLMVSPPGSMFDENEVPENVRLDIFKMAKGHLSNSFLCETRAETLSEKKVKEFSEIFSGKTACIELGFESSNKWVRKYSINKNLSDDDFLEAIRLLNKYGIFSIANVILGAPFLSPRQSINDAVSSIKWLLDHCVDECVLFPVHVKRGTIVEALRKHNLYQPPSIWSLIEVMSILGEEVSSKITISWYKPYEKIRKRVATSTAQDFNCLQSPDTCPKCYNQVIGLLDEYRKHSDYAVINKLSNMKCECKNRWKKSIETEAELSPSDYAKKAYQKLGMNILGEDWWKKNGEGILSKVNCYTD